MNYEKIKNCGKGKFCCEGQLHLYNVYDALFYCHMEQGHPRGDLTCEMITIVDLIENCPYCKDEQRPLPHK